MDVQGKTVIVTGGARGIGRGVAEAFAREGARVVIGDLGSLAQGGSGKWDYGLAAEGDLERTAAAIRDTGAEVLTVELDVTEADSCRRLVASATQAFGGVDVLVNNAGLVKMGDLASYSEEDWDRLFAVNTKGVFLCSRAAIPAITERGGGAIVNIASIAGKRGYAFLGAYCASKFAVVGLSQSMAQELAGANIRVNAICPGFLATAMWMEHLSVGVGMLSGKAAGREAFEDYVSQHTPLGREQTAGDIAEAALYLVHADNVTGVALNVAGGTEMW